MMPLAPCWFWQISVMIPPLKSEFLVSSNSKTDTFSVFPVFCWWKLRYRFLNLVHPFSQNGDFCQKLAKFRHFVYDVTCTWLRIFASILPRMPEYLSYIPLIATSIIIYSWEEPTRALKMQEKCWLSKNGILLLLW